MIRSVGGLLKYWQSVARRSYSHSSSGSNVPAMSSSTTAIVIATPAIVQRNRTRFSSGVFLDHQVVRDCLRGEMTGGIANRPRESTAALDYTDRRAARALPRRLCDPAARR